MILTYSFIYKTIHNTRNSYIVGAKLKHTTTMQLSSMNLNKYCVAK